MDSPGPLILISAVIGFMGAVMFSGAIILLNHVYLKEHVPSWARPGRMVFCLLTLAFMAYLGLAGAYIYLKFS